MKYIFSSQFLKILPPDTSFGDAWEGMCLDLLRSDDPSGEYVHLGPPDRGVDILHRNERRAYQCKSDERGASGTIPAAASLDSLRTAAAHMRELGWIEYYFATNANYSGKGFEDVLSLSLTLGLSKDSIKFRGPEYWSELCSKHIQRVRHRLDYRLLVSEAEVVEAFRKARYYENKVEEYRKLIEAGTYVIELPNNRTPLRLQIPFSPELTIKHCLNVAMELLDLSLEGEDYFDLNTSARPSVSITIDRFAQGFQKKLGDYTEEEIQRLELWITVKWKDGLEGLKPQKTYDPSLYTFEVLRELERLNLDPAERGKMTIKRFEEFLQQKMWKAVPRLVGATPTSAA